MFEHEESDRFPALKTVCFKDAIKESEKKFEKRRKRTKKKKN